MTVYRWVVTHLNKDGDRVLAGPCQGRATYRTKREAEAHIQAMKKNNSRATLTLLYRLPLEPRKVECWPGHFDQKGIYAP
jgi:hypothetical protein